MRSAGGARRDESPLRPRGSSRGRAGSLSRSGSQTDAIVSLRRAGSQSQVAGDSLNGVHMSPKAVSSPIGCPIVLRGGS